MQQIVLTHLGTLSGLEDHCKLKCFNIRFQANDQKSFRSHIVQKKKKKKGQILHPFDTYVKVIILLQVLALIGRATTAILLEFGLL